MIMSTLLKLQIGPVQDFIAQARSTRDLWSGSFLISWMMAQFVARLREEFGGGKPDFVFPAMSGSDVLPTIRWLEGKLAEKVEGEAKKALLPAIPNRLLAVLPKLPSQQHVSEPDISRWVAEVFEYRADTPWHALGEACWKFFEDHGQRIGGEDPKKRWDDQLNRFWQVTWVLQEWKPAKDWEEALKYPTFERADKPRGDRADWDANYLILAHRLDARRHTRNFRAETLPAPAEKDALSGREAALLDEEWFDTLFGEIKTLRESRRTEDDERRLQNLTTLAHLFRHDDPLAAINIVKRVWHRACLLRERDDDNRKVPGAPHAPRLDRKFYNMPSIPGIAAFPWGVELRKARKLILNDPDSAELARCVKAVQRVIEIEGRSVTMDVADRRQGELLEDWISRMDWQILQPTFWKQAERTAKKRERPELEETARKGGGIITKFLKDHNLGAPGRYYAVLAMDGDGMGRWLSGENFGSWLTADLHTRLSRGLARTAQEHIKPIVEDPLEKGADQPHPYQGKVIYAGADDALALLPGQQSLNCARAIRDIFKRVMGEEVPSHLRKAEFGISAGIAIGHIKEPLQDLVECAFEELHRAKRELLDYPAELHGDAVAVTLFKRSGEQIQWWARFDSPAFPLLGLFQEHYHVPADQPEKSADITGRFPHRLTELLAPYGPAPMTAQRREIVLAELASMIPRQITGGDKVHKRGPDLQRLHLEFRLRAEAYARELELLGRPLPEFYHLFNLEEFVTRDLA